MDKPFIENLGRIRATRVSRSLTDEEHQLGTAAFDAYLKLLPLGSLNCPAKLSFLSRLGVTSSLALQKLVDFGLAARPSIDEIVLTEHPFQIRQALAALERLPERGLASNWLTTAYATSLRSPSIHEAVFAVYLSPNSESSVAERLQRLNAYAEFAGVGAPLADGLEFLLKNVRWDVAPAVRQDAATKWQKLTRTSYNGDEEQFNQRVAAQKAWWIGLRSLAEKDGHRFHDGLRLDRILYEIAYCDYLVGSYDAACTMFGHSVHEGVEAIRRGLRSPEDELASRCGTEAFENIWITAVLERLAAIRLHIEAYLKTGNSPDTQELVRLSNQIDSIHSRLSAANGVESDSNWPMYLHALASIKADSDLPNGAPRLKLDRTRLIRHESSALHHSVQATVWPRLFGLPNVPGFSAQPNAAESPSTPVWPPAATDGIAWHTLQSGEILTEWYRNPAENWEILFARSIASAAVLLGGGGFEYVGDLLLLAYECSTDPETKDAVAAYVLERLPSIGMNDLAKTAIRKKINQRTKD